MGITGSVMMSWTTLLFIAILLNCLMLVTLTTQTGITLILFGITFAASAAVVFAISGIILLGIVLLFIIANRC
jgi:hypothetical protein